MQNSWRFFILVEAILSLFLLYQIFSNPTILIFAIVGILCILLGSKTKKALRWVFLSAGIVTVVVVTFLNITAWLMILLLIVFLALRGFDFNYSFKDGVLPWQKKSYEHTETVEPDIKQGARLKRRWFGNEHIGRAVFEWDDINYDIFAGDTIIDLGNTLLPKEDSVILIRKGFGKTRILVPMEMGVMLEHATLGGNIHFEQNVYHLSNESVKLFSKNYDESPRRLKIVTNTLFGDLEVIAV